ncbi:MAG: response regulator [Myxococcales bacterium]|nr:response regulator [Myxococcales bacterium]
MVHPDDRARVGAAIGRSLETGVYEDLELRAVGSDGKLRSILIRGDVTRDGEGRPTALRGAVLDLTAQKQLEEQLRQAVKMDAVGQLAGGVAHDFNNLMLVILASVDLAAAAPDKPRRDELLAGIRSASERAAALTRQLLVLSQRQPLARGVVDVAEVASELLRLLRRVVPASVEIELVAGEPVAPVAGDRGQIEQVLMNLCINARDAMPSGGRLTIRIENVVVEGRNLDGHPWASPGRYVLLAVSDTGTGMTPEMQARIFEPFFTTKPPGRGTGLGLPVAYGIVQQHGGILHVESELGRGSTFEVCLPTAEGPPSAPRREVEGVAPGGHETILVAEDDEGVRRVVEHILGGAGYRVLVATDGEQAVRAFAEAAEEVQLLLLDMVMPRLGGLDALERIRALQPAVRAILTSGYSDAWRTDDPRLAGVDLLPKPYAPHVLLRTVRAMLDRDG